MRLILGGNDSSPCHRGEVEGQVGGKCEDEHTVVWGGMGEDARVLTRTSICEGDSEG